MPLRPALVTVTLPGGLQLRYSGLYASVLEAVLRARQLFPLASRISGKPA